MPIPCIIHPRLPHNRIVNPGLITSTEVPT